MWKRTFYMFIGGMSDNSEAAVPARGDGFLPLDARDHHRCSFTHGCTRRQGKRNHRLIHHVIQLNF